MTTDPLSICALCGLEVRFSPILTDENLFCCAGCHAVYSVLAAKSELEQGIEHPLVREAVSAGLISHPALLEELKRKQDLALSEEIEKEKISFSILGMWCPSCALLIQYLLLRKKGVVRCVVDYSMDLAVVEFQPHRIGKEEIFTSIRAIGYSVETFDDPAVKKAIRSLTMRAVITGFFALNVMMLAYPLYATFFDSEGDAYGLLFAWLSCFASIPIMTYGAMPIYRRFAAALKTGYWGMETLVVLGSGAAVLLSLWRLAEGNPHVYFDTAAVIIALVLAGKAIESRSKFSAKQTLFRLAKTQPRRGRRVGESGKREYMPIDEIRKGDLVQTLAGERIILDGIVISGEASCDESLLTGEGLPVWKQEGSRVIGGSTVLHGSLMWRAEAEFEESLQQRIIQLVQHDLGDKAVKEKRLEVLLRWFIPSIVVLAFFSGLGTYMSDGGLDEAYIQALSVLLIACPCALGIAIPLAESRLIQKLAEMGVLVRNRACLQSLGSESCFLFDKTGTVTHGTFQVLAGLDSLTEKQKSAVRAIAKFSTHPISQALVRAIKEREENATGTVEFAGQGMKGKVGGNQYLYGSARFMKLQGVELPDKEESPFPGSTECWIAENGCIISHLFLGDAIKPDVKETLKGLEPCPAILLSGDGGGAVASIAKQCGFQYWESEYTPLQKREYVLERKKKGIVAMVGDGINDAPALTASDIAISVLSAADISIQVSDLLLTTEKLSILPNIRKLAQKARRIIRQNLFWAFFYNIAGIGLALVGLLSPLYSAFAMVASSLFVILNAQRCK